MFDNLSEALSNFQFLNADGSVMVPVAKKPDIFAEFRFNRGGNRERFLEKLAAKMGIQVSVEELLIATCGDASPESVMKLGSLIGGLKWRIKMYGLAYVVKVKGATVGLHPIATKFNFS